MNISLRIKILFSGLSKSVTYLSLILLVISADEGVAFFGSGKSSETKGSKGGINSYEPFFVPDDLKLSKVQLRGSQALAHFAYGLFRQLEAGKRSDQAHKQFMKAVESEGEYMQKFPIDSQQVKYQKKIKKNLLKSNNRN